MKSLLFNLLQFVVVNCGKFQYFFRTGHPWTPFGKYHGHLLDTFILENKWP